MARTLAWIRSNFDGVVALVIALAVGMIALVDVFEDVVKPGVVTSAILVVLALLATTMLRDRHLSQQALRDASSVHLLSGPEIGHAHTMARHHTGVWIFKGGTGTYIRAVTLRECVANARREQRPLHVQLEILDPTNEQLCMDYAQFRSSLVPGPDRTGESWTPDRTRKESFATILAVCWHKQRYTFLTAEIGLSSVMSTFRWDLSSSCVIVTQDNPNTPALMFEHDKPHYRDFHRELVTSFGQARRVPLDRSPEAMLDEEPTVDQARALFDLLGTPLPTTYSDRDVADIMRRALQARNPYS